MKLYTHQQQALTWIKDKPKAILALDMGLGKTCIASLDLTAPAIVVCPASLKLNWAAELDIWRPELSVQIIKSSKDKPNGSDVTIINYDLLGKVDLHISTTLVVDEAHYIKSYKAKRTKLLMATIKATPKVRLLTGTPVVNRPIELWTLLYSTGTTKLGYFEFGMRYCGGWKTPWDTYDFSGSSRQDELVRLLTPSMLRLTKEECIDLPSKTYRIIELDLPLDSREKQFVQSAIDKPDSVAFEAISDIRKLNAERKLDPSIAYIKDCLEQTSKVVVFAHHSHIIDSLMDALKEYAPVKITGSVANDDRHNAVQAFQTDAKCRVFIGNIKAAGVGLTLTAASHVIFVESSWSPAEMNQAADRCHRIGQKDNVTVDLLTISKSIDSLILHSVLTKMDTIDRIIKESHIMDYTQIAAKLRELADLFDQPVEKVAKPAKVPTDPAKQIPLAIEPVATKAEPAKTEPTKAEPSPIDVAAAPTLDDIRQAMAKLIGAGKRDRAVAILAELGVAKVSEIPEDKFAEAMEKVSGSR